MSAEQSTPRRGASLRRLTPAQAIVVADIRAEGGEPITSFEADGTLTLSIDGDGYTIDADGFATPRETVAA